MSETSVLPTVPVTRAPCHVIVLGNSKGGTGKSTTALHLVVGLLRDGHRVGSMDLDAGQGTLSRYLENRATYAERHGQALPMPSHRAVTPGDPEDEARAFHAAYAALAPECDYLVIDTQGSDSPLSRLGHSYADTLVTPLNDSLVDLDLFAQLDPDTLEIRSPSRYADMVFEQRKQKMMRQRRSIDWIVMRNRLSHLDARNKREMGDILDRLARRIGFRTAPGFGERVIFRELFLKGLTLLDLRDAAPEGGFTMSHLAARQEVRTLLDAIGLTDSTAQPGRAHAGH